MSTIGRPVERVWPPAAVLRDTAALLAGLVLVALTRAGLVLSRRRMA